MDESMSDAADLAAHSATLKTYVEESAINVATAKNNATVSTVDAKIASDNAAASTINAQTAKANADASTTDAGITKSNATASIADAQATKDNAAASTEDAATTKINASASITDAQVTKSSAEASKLDAATAKACATDSTTDAQTTKNNAKTSTESAKTASSNAAATVVDADNAKSNFVLISQELEKVKAARVKAETEAQNAARAHNMSTTVGLAGAFTEKARKAVFHQYLWVVALLGSLVAVGIIAWLRFETVSSIVQGLIEKNQDLISAIVAELLLSGLGLGAPIWFAWISSKMVSKYFHLSEDYSYKAVISKAYLGFKEQASGLDPIFQERLFAAAITELDANPLRFFTSVSHPGSPMQDLLDQPFMQAALKNDSFKEGVILWLNKVFKTNFYVPKINFGEVSNDVVAKFSSPAAAKATGTE